MEGKADEMLRVYVFSYNRPQFLENCLNSIIRHAPNAGIYVLDDDSSDPDVMKVLDFYSKEHEVYIFSRGASAGGIHGGLYCNMQRAFEHGAEEGADIALFVQDDMQLVRDITSKDLVRIHEFFEREASAVVLDVCFFKEIYHNANLGNLVPRADRHAYFHASSEISCPTYFCDVGIFNIGRLKELDWSFEQGEAENNKKAKQKALTLGRYLFPFMMYLPYPKTNYYKRASILLKGFEWWVGAGFFPYKPMDTINLNRLFERELSELPEAEKFLISPCLSRDGPWIFGGAIIEVIELGGFPGRVAGLAGRLLKTISFLRKKKKTAP